MIEEAKILPLNAFLKIPKEVLCFWLPSQILLAYAKEKPFSPEHIDARRGMASGDNPRFYKLWWEVPANEIGREKTWSFLANGGSPAPLYRQQVYVVNYRDDGKEVKQHVRQNYGSDSRTIVNQGYYYQSGLTFGKRTESFTVQYLPGNQVFSNEGQAIFTNSENENILAFLNSSLVAYLLNSVAGQHKEAGYINTLPSPPAIFLDSHEIKNNVVFCYNAIFCISCIIPESQNFISPFFYLSADSSTSISRIADKIISIENDFSTKFIETDKFLERNMGFSTEDSLHWKHRSWSLIKILYGVENTDLSLIIAVDLLGYFIGVIFCKMGCTILEA
jgi:hypothetical protein